MKTTISVLALTTILLAGCASSPSATPTTPAPQINDYTAPPQGTGTPSPTQTTAAATTGHKIGEVVKLEMAGQDAAQVTIVSAAYVPTIGSGALAHTAKKGGFLVLDVVWETTAGVSNSNPYNFNVKDAAGHGGDNTYGTGDDIPGDPIPAGDKAAGKVAFDVGPGPWRLAVSPGSKPTYWSITL